MSERALRNQPSKTYIEEDESEISASEDPADSGEGDYQPPSSEKVKRRKSNSARIRTGQNLGGAKKKRFDTVNQTLEHDDSECDRNFLQYTQPLIVSQGSISQSDPSTSSDPSSPCSSPKISGHREYFIVQDFIEPIIMDTSNEINCVEVYAPLPFSTLYGTSLSATDIDKTVFSARLCVKVPASDQSIQFSNQETVIIVKNLRVLTGWVGLRPTLVYSLSFVPSLRSGKDLVRYLGHKFTEGFLDGSAFGRRAQQSVLLLCKVCFSKKAYENCVVSSKANSSTHFYTHCRRHHKNDNIVRSTVPFYENFSQPPSVPELSYARQVELVANLIVSTCSSLRMADDPEFCKVLKELNPGYFSPGRFTVTKYIRSEAERLERQLKEILHAEASACCLASDIWTSRSQDGVIAVAVTYVDKQFNLKKAMLGMHQLRGSHTGELIASVLEKMLVKFGIAAKHLYSITDAGSNMLRAIRLLERNLDRSDIPPPTPSLECIFENDGDSDCAVDETSETTSPISPVFPDCIESSESETTSAELLSTGFSTLNTRHIVKLHVQFRCVAHSLNTCLKTAVEDEGQEMVRMLIEASKALIRAVRTRCIVSEQLRDLVGKSVVPNVETRWNSLLDSLLRLTEPNVFKALTSVIAYERRFGKNKNGLPQIPTVDDFVYFQQLVRLLAPFSIAIDRLQRDGLTAHEVIPEIVHIYYCLDTTPTSEGGIINSFRKALIKQLVFRFSSIFDTDLYLGAMLFSPEHKFFLLHYHDVLPSNPFKAPTHAEAVNRIRGLLPPGLTTACRSSNIVRFSAVAKQELSVFDKYMAMGSSTGTISEFWLSSDEALPGLAAAAKTFYCVPATTAYVERFFSATGQILSKLRCKMTIRTMEAIFRYKNEKLKCPTIVERRPYKHSIPEHYLLQYLDGLPGYLPLPIITEYDLQAAIADYETQQRPAQVTA